MHASSEGKSDDSEDRIYEGSEQIFYDFPKYHRKILLGNFNAKVGSGNIFTPTPGNGVYIRI
jgi:hypothetical protein